MSPKLDQHAQRFIRGALALVAGIFWATALSVVVLMGPSLAIRGAIDLFGEIFTHARSENSENVEGSFGIIFVFATIIGAVASVIWVIFKEKAWNTALNAAALGFALAFIVSWPFVSGGAPFMDRPIASLWFGAAGAIAGIVTWIMSRPGVLAVIGILMSGFAGLLYLLSMAFAGRSGPEAAGSYEQVNFPLAVRKEREVVGPSGRSPIQLTWSPDGSTIAGIINLGDAVVWDRAGRELSRFNTDAFEPEGSLAFINGASQLLSPCCQSAQGAHPLLDIFDVATGKHVRAVDNPQPGKWFLASPITVSPDQKHVAMAMSASNEVVIVSANDWTFRKTYAVSSTPHSIAYDADNNEVTVGSMDGIVSIIDTRTANTPQELRVFQTPADSDIVGAVSASPDARYIFAGSYGFGGKTRAVVVRASDGTQVASFPLAGVSNTEQAQWDPKGRYVAILDGANHVFLWLPFAPSLSYAKITLPGLTGGINCMAVSPNGDHIAASTDHGFLIFSVGTP